MTRKTAAVKLAAFATVTAVFLAAMTGGFYTLAALTDTESASMCFGAGNTGNTGAGNMGAGNTGSGNAPSGCSPMLIVDVGVSPQADVGSSSQVRRAAPMDPEAS